MTFVHGPNGHFWRVGRPVLPWRPRLRARSWFDLGESEPNKPVPGSVAAPSTRSQHDGADLLEFGAGVVLLAIAALVLAVEWLAAVMVGGLLAAVRVLCKVPWRVEARPVGRTLVASDGVQPPLVYAREVDGWRASAAVAAEAAREIALNNVPSSLDLVVPERVDPWQRRSQPDLEAWYEAELRPAVADGAPPLRRRRWWHPFRSMVARHRQRLYDEQTRPVEWSGERPYPYARDDFWPRS